MAFVQASGMPMVPASQVESRYAYWRVRLLYTLIIGYAAFYLVRQNIQIAVPLMLKEFGYTKTQIGWVFSAFPVIYGIGKFFSGALCDRVNVRYYMAGGLILASLMSIAIGFAPTFSAGLYSHCHIAITPLCLIAIFYSFNGLFQATGWPPIARLMTNWFAPTQLGTYWGMVNASHQIGSITILIGGAWLGKHFGWQSIFFVPAVVCLVIAVFLLNRLCDTPESEGLPPLFDGKDGRKIQVSNSGNHATFKEIFYTHILPNRALWLVCWANFFLYVVRMGFFNWAPTFLQESRGSSVMGSSLQTAFFEITGIIAGIAAGYISDRWAGGKRNAVCAIFMVFLIFFLLLFWGTPGHHPIFDTFLLGIIGFFVYGPQTLAGIAGAEFGSARAAATANGLTGLFGYAGAIFSGFGIGLITDHFGWGHAILFCIACAGISLAFFAMNWSQTSLGNNT